MGVGGVIGSMGGVSYDIVAADKTKDAIDSAKDGIDSVGVHYSDTLTNIAFSINEIKMAADVIFGVIQGGFEATVGAAMEFSNELNDLKDITDISYGNLQRLKAGAIAVGANFTDVSSSISMLTRKISEGGEAGKELEKRLADIGVTVKDSNGNWKDTYTLYWDILKALNEMPNQYERNNLAVTLLGRSALNTASMWQDYDTAAQAAAEAEPISDEDITKAHNISIEIDQLNEKIHLAAQTAGMELLPATKEWIELIERSSREDSGFFSALNAFLKRSAQGFEMLGMKDTFVRQVLTGDIEGAKDTLLEFRDWLKKEQQDEVLEGQEYIEGTAQVWSESAGKYVDAVYNIVDGQVRLVEKTAETAKKAVTATGEALASTPQIKAVSDAEEDRIRAITDAYKDYTAEVKKLREEKEDLADLDKDYYEDVMDAGRDLSQIASLNKTHDRAKRDALKQISREETAKDEAAARLGLVSKGTPLSQIPGTPEYEQAQATQIGTMVGTIHIEKVEVGSKDDWDSIVQKAIANKSASDKVNRVQNGVRTAQ